MDKSRQHNSRYQRTVNKGSYQQNTVCGSANRMNYDCNKSCNMGCNQYRCETMPMKDCPCMRKDELEGMPLGMAYVPWQHFGNLYEECEAVYHGTIFHDLDLDFCGMRCE